MIAKEARPLWAGAGRLVLACLFIALVLLVQTGRAQAAQDSTSLPSNIPVKREAAQDTAGASGGHWWLAITAAVGLLGVAVLAARRRPSVLKPGAGPLWSRFGGLLEGAASNEIQRVSSTRLSPRHSLHVVVWNGRRLLLGCTDQSIQLLAESSSGPGERPASPAEPDART